ncbi:MAG: 16S rRNA (guanine(966)-N(2))-methyltransferase RsmD, partial [Candidatus Omnitrophica bacterium]|nr:16S rRNA (guanine(966)-N(2))-methyltransferase RsmD [Candidatus Omnitrophota bacterium]
MKIKSGIYKGRVFLVPKGIRPTQDIVRKALFDILGDMSGLSFLELFAGSGSVGLEALSHGAKSVTFVEIDRNSSLILENNIKSILSTDYCLLTTAVITSDVFLAIAKLANQPGKFDIIFADPPYYKGLPEKTLQSLGEYDILKPLGFLV